MCRIKKLESDDELFESPFDKTQNEIETHFYFVNNTKSI